MKKNNNISFLIVTFISFLFLASCRPTWKFAPLDNQVINGSFPKNNIVFQLGPNAYGRTDKIGFSNADASSVNYFYLPENSTLESVDMVFPTWTDEGSIIFYRAPINLLFALIEKDYPLSIKLKNEYVSQLSLIHGTQEILLNSGLEDKFFILREDYTTGKILETYYMEDDVYEIGIGTNNLVDGKLLYQQWIEGENDIWYNELVVRNTETEQETIVLKNSGTPQDIRRIISPAFSPDGSWIAYTSNDGIYLIRPDGSENHQVVALRNAYSYWPSRASWSPDGESIVYHHCTVSEWQGCAVHNDDIKNSIIYRYDIETEEETVLVEGGLNPYWRWKEIK